MRSRRPSGPITVAPLSETPLPAVGEVVAPWPGAATTAAQAHVYVRHTPATADGAEPALYVHGLAGSSTNWTDLAARLAPWLSADAIDLPGFGRSGPAPRGNYSIAAFARVVIAYLERRDRGPVHLVGNSMGGAVCLRVAALRPDLVRTLTLISPAVPDLRVRREGSDPLLALLIVPGAGTVVERRMNRLGAEQRARGLIAVCFADPARVSDRRLAEAADEVRERWELPWASQAFTRSLRGIVVNYLTATSVSSWRLLARIQAPTLVVWGQQDRLVDVALAPRVARTVPDARLLVLPDVGHVAQLEDPDITARAILRLVEDQRRGAETRPAASARRAAPEHGNGPPAGVDVGS